MRILHFILGYLAMFVLLFSCTKIKKECNDIVIKQYDNDTIFPSDYLMLYPGSWWTYTDGDSIKVSEWIHVKTHKSIPNGNCRTIYENNHILPGNIYDTCSIQTFLDLSDTKYKPIISETPGVIYKSVTKISEGTNTYTITVYPKVDTMTVNHVLYYDVIKVKHYSEDYYPYPGYVPMGGRIYFYSKNVGLIKLIYLQGGAEVHTNELVNYFISPH